MLDYLKTKCNLTFHNLLEQVPRTLIAGLFMAYKATFRQEQQQHKPPAEGISAEKVVVARDKTALRTLGQEDFLSIQPTMYYGQVNLISVVSLTPGAKELHGSLVCRFNTQH